MKLDLDVVVFDFDEGFREQPEDTLCAFQALLLDETHCRARVEFLRALQNDAEKNMAHLLEALEKGDFSSEIAAIIDVGTFAAVRQGMLDPERLAALTRAPDSLWQAHKRLTAIEDETPEDDTPFEDNSAIEDDSPIEDDTRKASPSPAGSFPGSAIENTL